MIPILDTRLKYFVPFGCLITTRFQCHPFSLMIVLCCFTPPISCRLMMARNSHKSLTSGFNNQFMRAHKINLKPDEKSGQRILQNTERKTGGEGDKARHQKPEISQTTDTEQQLNKSRTVLWLSVLTSIAGNYINARRWTHTHLCS